MSPREPALFSPGDVVKLKTGKSPQRIVKIRWDQYQKIWKVFAYYLSSDREIKRHQEITGNYDIPDVFLRRPRDQHDFEIYQPTEEKETVMTDLYQIVGSEGESSEDHPKRFGTFLTQNSQGEYVLEMKGENGKVEAFPKDWLELVVPYTVQLVCVPPSESGMHIQAEPGKLNKGDLLILESNGKMFRVAAVDTKNRSPRHGSLTFFKLSGESLTVGNDN